jgi:ABC-type oligopeptide transport system substrate-binding subunit
VRGLAFQAGEPRSDYLTRQWKAALGIEIEWAVLPWAAFLEQFVAGSAEIALLMWAADYPDPDNFLRVCREKAWARWRNETYEDLVEEARRLMDPQERMRRYREADRLVCEEVPILPLTYERDHLLIKPWLSRYPTSATHAAYWKEAVIGSRPDG